MCTVAILVNMTSMVLYFTVWSTVVAKCSGSMLVMHAHTKALLVVTVNLYRQRAISFAYRHLVRGVSFSIVCVSWLEDFVQ